MPLQASIFARLIDKLHTTELGVMRIKRNLGLDCIDDCNVVDFCKQQILHSSDITRKGKNWYVVVDDIIITVNAHNFCIITAHRNK